MITPIRACYSTSESASLQFVDCGAAKVQARISLRGAMSADMHHPHRVLPPSASLTFCPVGCMHGVSLLFRRLCLSFAAASLRDTRRNANSTSRPRETDQRGGGDLPLFASSISLRPHSTLGIALCGVQRPCGLGKGSPDLPRAHGGTAVSGQRGKSVPDPPPR